MTRQEVATLAFGFRGFEILTAFLLDKNESGFLSLLPLKTLLSGWLPHLEKSFIFSQCIRSRVPPPHVPYILPRTIAQLLLLFLITFLFNAKETGGLGDIIRWWILCSLLLNLPHPLPFTLADSQAVSLLPWNLGEEQSYFWFPLAFLFWRPFEWWVWHLRDSGVPAKGVSEHSA